MDPHFSHSTPFKGLMSYTEEDTQLFFGREEIRDLIIGNMQARLLTVLYGASGAGKSSVLHAGVVPTLRDQGRQIMVDNQLTTPGFSVITFNAWSDDPVARLARAIHQHITALLNGTNQPLAEPPTLSAALDQWMTATDSELYIILDQFEEYFQYHGRKGGPGTFATEFPRAVSRKNHRIKFLISIREEAYAKLDMFKGTFPSLFRDSLRIQPLDEEAARTAIEGPIRQYNALAGAEPVAIEPELLEAVLESVKQAESASDLPVTDAGPGKIDLTILQQVMIKLWDEEVRQNGSNLLRLSTFERLGRARSIVRSHFSSAMERLTPADQKTAASIFRYLVTPSGTKIAQTAVDLADYSELSKESVSSVLEKLASGDVRILRAISAPPDHPGEVRYEIFHDVLSGPIIEWWRGFEANERSERVRLEAARDKELVHARYSLRIAIGLGVAAVVFLALLGWAHQQNQDLKEARRMDGLSRDAFRQSRRKERKTEAIKNFNEALAVYLKGNQPGDHTAATDTYINIGEIHAEMGNEREASENFQNAIKRSKDESERAAVLTSIGDAYRELDPALMGSGADPRRKAVEKYEEALWIYQDKRAAKKQAEVLISLALAKHQLSHKLQVALARPEREKAYRLIEQAIDIYKREQDHKGVGFAMFTLADTKAPRVDFSMTDELLQTVTEKMEEALKEYELAHDPQGQILARKRLAEYYGARRDRNKTVEHLSEISSIYERQLDDKAAHAAFLVETSAFEFGTPPIIQRNKSFEDFRKAAGLYEDAQRHLAAAQTWESLSVEYGKDGNKEAATESLEKAGNLYHLSGNHSEEIVTKYKLFTLYRETDKGKALSYLDQLTKLSEQTNNKAEKASALVNLGYGYLDLEDREKASNYFEQGVSIYHELKDVEKEADTLVGISEAYLKRSFLDESINYLNRARLLYQGSPYETAETLMKLAKVYTAKKDPMKAIELYEEAAKLYNQNEAPLDEEVALAAIGTVYESMGDKKKAELYKQRAQTALQTAQVYAPSRP